MTMQLFVGRIARAAIRKVPMTLCCLSDSDVCISIILFGSANI